MITGCYSCMIFLETYLIIIFGLEIMRLNMNFMFMRCFTGCAGCEMMKRDFAIDSSAFGTSA